MLGDDISVLIDVPGWVNDCALPGLFRAYHIGIVGQTFDSDGFNERTVAIALGWDLSLRSIVKVMGARRALMSRAPAITA